ncbi:MAG: hydroxymethylglutaryl-CoA reductase, degradative [Bacteroidales bacterium]|nr:hydroxymethylglutaryl-CoA reductase, degradative [Bacteroidales bacterium]
MNITELIRETTTGEIIKGFSKLDKEQKIELVSRYFDDPGRAAEIIKQYWHPDSEKQKLFEEFSENTISNFFFPYGIAPNFIINGNNYMVPMVIEESSVVAAASSSAKFWAERGGFHAKVISTTKTGQVHFTWNGSYRKLKEAFPELKQRLFERTADITHNMRRRGGGIIDIELVNKTHAIEDYYQLKATFNTVDSMGANFINSCLEEFAAELKNFILADERFEEKEVEIIMAILSNYSPECVVKTHVECDVSDLDDGRLNMTTDEFAWKFEKGVQIANIDQYRAVTHNKGIFNGIDAVALATGNDFRAIEASGHAFASRQGQYKGLTELSLENGRFHYSLTIPLSMGTVGGLTSLHPLAKLSLELLGEPSAREMMMIASSVGLANNFSAVRSLVTTGIQQGHMKMHLLNILNIFQASEEEKEHAVEYFKDKKVSFKKVSDFIAESRR